MLPTKSDCYKGESNLKPYEDAIRFILTLPLVASLWLIGDAVAISQLSDQISAISMCRPMSPALIPHCVIDFVVEMNDRMVNKLRTPTDEGRRLELKEWSAGA